MLHNTSKANNLLSTIPRLLIIMTIRRCQAKSMLLRMNLSLSVTVTRWTVTRTITT